jgi:hypothetical protein
VTIGIGAAYGAPSGRLTLNESIYECKNEQKRIDISIAQDVKSQVTGRQLWQPLSVTTSRHMIDMAAEMCKKKEPAMTLHSQNTAARTPRQQTKQTTGAPYWGTIQYGFVAINHWWQNRHLHGTESGQVRVLGFFGDMVSHLPDCCSYYALVEVPSRSRHFAQPG